MSEDGRDEGRDHKAITRRQVLHGPLLVRAVADRVAVMTDGRIVELGSVERVLAEPRAEYTRLLLSNTPSVDSVLSHATNPGG
jgi:ABC-type oligopeptide transport system ATPase subunit